MMQCDSCRRHACLYVWGWYSVCEDCLPEWPTQQPVPYEVAE